MTDRILTPEVYGDFGLFMEQMGLRNPRLLYLLNHNQPQYSTQ